MTWSLTGTDRSDFSISADGVLTFVKTPNYEAPEDSGGDNDYEFSVVATDVLLSGSSRRDGQYQAVTVTVGDVEEAGTLTVDNLIPAAGETVTFVADRPGRQHRHHQHDLGYSITGDRGIMDDGHWRTHARLDDLPLDR